MSKTASFHPLLLVIACSLLLSSGCDSAPGESPTLPLPVASTPPPIQVIGAPWIDFGKVKVVGENLKHTFRIKNTLAEPVTVTNSRKTCGCVDVQVSPLILDAGAESLVTVEMETRLFTGRKKTSVILEFDHPRVEPLILGVEAFMVSDYSGNVSPRVWSVTSAEEQITRVRRKFRAIEFLSSELADGKNLEELNRVQTTIHSKSDLVQVEKVGEWEPVGWRAFGYAREADVELTLEIPAGFGDRDLEAVLEFRRPSEDEAAETSTEAPGQSCTVALSIRTF